MTFQLLVVTLITMRLLLLSEITHSKNTEFSIIFVVMPVINYFAAYSKRVTELCCFMF
jgi:hypothetical protein